MIAGLLRRLSGAGEAAPLPRDQARIALAALMVRLARADGDYAAIEVVRIEAALARRYELTPAQVAALRTEAEAVEAAAPDTVRFTRLLKDAVPLDERIGLIEALWSVVLADGTRDAGEDSLMRMIAPLLGISDTESAMARKRMEGRGL